MDEGLSNDSSSADSGPFRAVQSSLQDEENQAVVKYLRSKSLPAAAYLPPWNLNIPQTSDCSADSTDFGRQDEPATTTSSSINHHGQEKKHSKQPPPPPLPLINNGFGGPHRHGQATGVVGNHSSSGSTGHASSENSQSDAPNQDLIINNGKVSPFMSLIH